MKWLLTVAATLLLSVFAHSAHSAHGKPSRELKLQDSDIGQVQTALGYSTILQFDARPTSAVLGDQDAFKVEYVGQALTIKPLVPGARTNLFVFTDYERFNFRLVTGVSSQVDYVVKVKRKSSSSSFSGFEEPSSEFAPSSPSEKMTTVYIGKKASCRSTSLWVESISYPKAKPWLVVHFAVTEGKKEFQFKPESVVLTKGKSLLSIETLYLETASIPADHSKVRGSLLVRQNNPASSSQISLNFTPDHFKENRCSTLKVRLQPSK